MTLIQFFRIVSRYFYAMVWCALLAAGAAFWGTQHTEKSYQSSSVINTGLVTGYNIENSQSARIDFGYTNNEIENILSMFRSRETQEVLAVRLLAGALMLPAPDPEVLGPVAFAELQKMLPPATRTNFLVPGDTLQTTMALFKRLEQHGENPVKNLLESKHPLFGMEHLQEIVVKREGNTDMIRIAYTTTDPAVCRNTLSLLIEIAIAKHRSTKEGQSTSVLDFFEKATRESAATLAGKEDDLLQFMSGNKIINYYEQTRFIAAKKEDLDELYFKELMKLAAADSSRRHLELKLETRVNLPEINRSLLLQREQLAGVSARLAALDISAGSDSLEEVRARAAAPAASASLQKQAEALKKGLRQNTEALFAVNRTPEGMETKNLLGRWLDQWLEVEQTLARLEVLRDRKTEFDRIYSRFAPWGSKLKRIEREIDVAERAYLENLHSYNQARLHKHNMLMSTNLRVVDQPFFPEKAKPSKRALLIVLAGLAGLLSVLAVVVALEYLDNAVRSPERAAEATGLELASAFPFLPQQWQKDPSFDYAFLMQRAVGQWLQHLKLSLREQGVRHRPARIALLSTRAGEGKTQLAAVVIGQLRAAGERVLWLRPKQVQGLQVAGLDTAPWESDAASSHPDDRFFEVDHAFFDKKTENDLLNEAGTVNVDQYDYVFTEIPSILANTYPADYLAETDISFLLVRANRIWNRADTRALSTLHRVLGRPANLVLNAVRPDDLENAIGEVPKRRSALRQWLKKMVNLNFARTR